MCSKIVFWWCWGHVSLMRGCLMLEPVSCWTCCRRSAARAREHGQQSHAEKQMVVISHERPWWGTTVCGNTVQRQRHYHMEQKGGGVGGLYSCIGTLTYWAGGLTLVQMSCHKWSIQAEHTTGLQTTTTTDHVMVLATIKEKHKGRKTEKPVAKINVIHAIVDITA